MTRLGHALLLGCSRDLAPTAPPAKPMGISTYPNLLRVLFERGSSEADLQRICSGNVLRVWEAVEAYARAAR